MGENFVKVHDRCLKVGQLRRPVAAADETSTRLSQNAIHLADQLQRRADFGRGSGRSEVARRATQGFLGPLGPGPQVLPERAPFFLPSFIPPPLSPPPRL